MTLGKLVSSLLVALMFLVGLATSVRAQSAIEARGARTSFQTIPHRDGGKLPAR